MIELVFIIVILGILGAIAVPKMAASRDDARIVAVRQDVATAIQAIQAMVMSQGLDKVTTFGDFMSLSSDQWVVLEPHNGVTLENHSSTDPSKAANIQTKDRCVDMRLEGIKQRDNTYTDRHFTVYYHVTDSDDEATRKSCLKYIRQGEAAVQEYDLHPKSIQP